ncbi:unnamed protein product [Nezara viridula]|uniref:Uncharacterized protein n=1 Tax=Nezara viridula TaxID=85310 RepID=A0A9P0E8K1_NEZVI|nr:unnamed protein product [Nezara viridula]
MDGGREQGSTHIISLRLRTFIVGTLEFMLGACLITFHSLNLTKIIETRRLLVSFAVFLPDNEETSHHGYHVVSSILASIMISFSCVLFWGIFNYKENLVWAWLLSNSVLCILYGFLGVYGFILHYFWFMLENFVVIGCIVVFLFVVFPYYKYVPLT